MPNTHLKFNKAFCRDLWRLLKPYWTSEEKWSAWALLFMNIVCVVGGVRASVGYNYFNKLFFNALQDFNKSAIFSSLEYFLVVIFFLTLSMGGAVYFNGLLSLRWRRWLTQNYLQKWLHDHTHYRMQLLNLNVDNPDQRISEDLEKFPAITLSLFFGPYKFLYSLLMVISFGYILWDLSKNFVFHFGVIPGYLFWVALSYAAIGTWIMGWIGKKLAFLNYQQQQYNADFRFSLVRLREASEQVSLHRGESREYSKFNDLFSRIYTNFKALVGLQTRLIFFDKGYTFFSYAIGSMIAIPFYIAKVFQLGTVMQISSAFSSVVSGFSTFMDSFNDLAEWRSVIYRLTEFDCKMQNLQHSKNIKIETQQDQYIKVENLNLFLPNGNALLQKMNFNVSAGSSILLSGPSGIGKSTLMRALAGVWSYGDGKIIFPRDAKILFIPQKSYLPQGSFRDLLNYPSKASDETILHALQFCQLDKFKNHLNDIKEWSRELSLGEQQLIALTRIFIYQPDVIFLDEATSALDELTEAHIYKKIIDNLPNAMVVSAGRHGSLEKFHEKVIVLSQFAASACDLNIFF